jgi:dTDP-4-amino-4,6-dideoxygalactose transaminase
MNTWPFFAEDEVTAVTQVLTSGKVNYWTGEQCKLFEKEYAESVGTHYAVALYALDIGPGDEVITACRTFIATASCIVRVGAKPVIADVDLDSQNITASTIEPLITAKTKAIIVVHLAGWPCDMDSIMALAKKYNLFVIEDCAQAHGATYKDKPVGSFGDVNSFSFCQDKIITTGGEGGMVTLDSKTRWEKIWSLKDHGKSYERTYAKDHPVGFRWLHETFGTNWRMTEMQAAIGRIQLKKLSNWLELRRRNADILNKAFAEHEALRVTIPQPIVKHAYYKYYVFLRLEKLKSNWNRDNIIKKLQAENVPSFSGSCNDIANEKAFTTINFSNTTRPNAKLLGETSLMFLVHPTLSEDDMHRTAEKVIKIMNEVMQ